MTRINKMIWTLRIQAARLNQDVNGQDLIEYALMAGFVAVAAGALMPSVAGSISTVFSKISSVMTDAAAS
jgi:pilus assembly protein Flp/PilA